MTATRTKTEISYTVDVTTDVEFVDDHDYTIFVVPEQAVVKFVDGKFAELEMTGHTERGGFRVVHISDIDGLSDPWHAVAREILSACGW